MAHKVSRRGRRSCDHDDERIWITIRIVCPHCGCQYYRTVQASCNLCGVFLAPRPKTPWRDLAAFALALILGMSLCALLPQGIVP